MRHLLLGIEDKNKNAKKKGNICTNEIKSKFGKKKKYRGRYNLNEPEVYV